MSAIRDLSAPVLLPAFCPCAKGLHHEGPHGHLPQTVHSHRSTEHPAPNHLPDPARRSTTVRIHPGGW